MAIDAPEILMKKAGDDLRLAEAMLSWDGTTDEQLGFSAQQAVGKPIKSVLARRGVSCRKTHDLKELLGTLQAAGIAFPPELIEANVLTPFAVQFRYDDASYDEDFELPLGRSGVVRLARAAVEGAQAEAAKNGPA